MAEVTNKEFAAILERMAAIMEVQGENRFRVAAMQRAARAIESAPEIATLVDEDDPSDLSKLLEIDGIGEGLAERAVELVTTGSLDEYDQLLEEVPAGVVAMLDVPGLGPKTVARFWHEADIESPDELAARIDSDPESLTSLKGIGKKTLEKIGRNLEFAASAADRVRIGTAMPVAESLVEALTDVKGVQRVTYAGSLRRGRETIGDLDLLVAADADNAEAISEAFVELDPVDEVIAQGSTKTSVRLGTGLQVDLRIVEPGCFGAALMYFTGSKEHNVRLRERAIDRGGKLSEYGYFQDNEEEPAAAETEEAVYEALELPWIPPELREDRGEINLAENDELPALIESEDVVAELHAHTTASDGSWSIRELAEAAAERGCHTVAVTDHSVSQSIANGLSAARLEEHIEAVREVADDLADTITVLAGSEVDILADGSLDYEDELLAELDLVVASPHTALSQGSQEATDRLLRAIDHPYVTILGHPTGRLVGQREGLSPDMGRLIEAAADRGIALEINANHRRLDLRDVHARQALEAGVKLSINTDAHGPDHFNELRYGILTARRAGATAADVINCLGRDELAEWIQSTRD
ncbi:MAG: DNA polymerase/3'-5' exonuclease PolX [Phycisphaeraceae bacterium]|nr:DNA polymerase/3'-5' exonuclease PolX [Phycisphaeraceae bacterium]